MRNINLAYLCLQVTKEGQASHAHVHEIINNLRLMGVRVDLYQPNLTKKRTNLFIKIITYIYVQAKSLKNVSGYDLYYIRYHYFDLFLIGALILLRKKVVIEMNGSFSDAVVVHPKYKYIFKMFELSSIYYLKRVNAVVTVTPQLKQYYECRLRRNDIHVVPNAANEKKFKHLQVEKHKLKKPYALFFGALSPWQGIDIILQAAESEAWPDDMDLVVVGDGVERDKVKKSEKRSRNINYLGTVPYDDMPYIISNCFVSLCVKIDVGGIGKTGFSPLKFYESLSCGKPVIVTDVLFMSDLVRRFNCGIVLGQPIPDEIINALIKLKSNMSLYMEMCKNARKAIEDGNTWESRAMQTKNILCSVLHGGNERGGH